MFKTITINSNTKKSLLGEKKEKKIKKTYDNTIIPESIVQYNSICSINEIQKDMLRENRYLNNISLKLKSYAYQDTQIHLRKMKVTRNNKENNETNYSYTTISLDETLELLKKAELKCSYCVDELFILYKECYYPKQWTLDRIDNDLYHTKDNCVISCLSCNKSKRRRDDDKYRFSQQMKIEKV